MQPLRLLPIALGLVPHAAAFGCTSSSHAWRPELLLIALGAVLTLSVSVTAATVWVRDLVPATATRLPTVQAVVLANATALALALGALGLFMIPAFAQVHASFGPDLPQATRWLHAFAPGWWVPAVLLLGLRWVGTDAVRVRLCMALAIAQASLLAAALWSAYLPIHGMC